MLNLFQGHCAAGAYHSYWCMVHLGQVAGQSEHFHAIKFNPAETQWYRSEALEQKAVEQLGNRNLNYEINFDNIY